MHTRQNSGSHLIRGSATFACDQNGNLTQGHGENLSYDAFNKPLAISNAAQTLQTTFTYGADLMRYRQITPAQA